MLAQLIGRGIKWEARRYRRYNSHLEALLFGFLWEGAGYRDSHHHSVIPSPACIIEA